MCVCYELIGSIGKKILSLSLYISILLLMMLLLLVV